MRLISDYEEISKIKPVPYQSVIEYSYYNYGNKRLPVRGITGLIENQKNIWLHPPREFLFAILELNPYPYIHFPCKKGKCWRWTLEIGTQWGDARWKTWEKTIKNKYYYKIVDTECLLTTELGNLKCCKIEARAKSSLGKTFLTAYFNETYGFIRYDYLNIDNSQIKIEILKVE